MAIRVAVNHKTEYKFDRPVAVSPHVVRLRPAPHCRTRIEAYSLGVEPKNHFINWQQDPFGNYLARLVFPDRAKCLTFEVDLVAEMTVVNPFDFFLEEYADRYPFQYPPELRRDLEHYLEVTEQGPRLRDWLSEVGRSDQATVPFLVELNARLQRDIGYVVRFEAGVQACDDTLDKGTGSCRDSGWLLVQILRHLGLAARFVSGYLIQLSADVKSLDGPSGPEQDFTDLHAWAEVYLPGAGWVGLDPTSGLFAGEGHIPLACTPQPSSAAPVSGVTDKCEVDFYYHNRVTRIHEDPRVTKPYHEGQWQEILERGHRIDADLAKADVRLTFGGEPTFVSIDDMDAPEWNTAALGAHKRERAEELVRRLWQRFARGGVLHHGQGKWYPGEPLPRWALSVHWRADGRPVWSHPELLAEENRDYGAGAEEARRFAEALAGHLAVDPEHIVPAFEDAYYYLWKEQTLPQNLDPHDSHLRDPLERRRLTRIFDRGLEQVVGYALPLGWTETARKSGGWESARWHFRRERMYLVIGDSPMGFRLPLDSLPWEPESERDVTPVRDPFEERPPLDDAYGEVMHRYSRLADEPPPRDDITPQPPADAEPPPSVVRTALCVEPRDGRLYLFLPPLTHLEHYLALLGRIEAVALELEQPVVIEGYEPPHDHRLSSFRVTPDPGVIEVNIHPTDTWGALVETTEALYAEARLARLGTEKFMLDGRHTGTGGGNHVTIGARSPADSPFLRRPDLLASLVLYWQHHPSLSYLFSGLFVGPTSQAPRVDEARDEVLHELEIAIAELPRGDVQTPWLVDRLFRNLLVDVTGNTHRAEFCIDKLYSPDTPAGRLGLLEFRGFEMPPHPQMSLVQMLLLRALIAWFWREPYRRRPVRWGTALHDRFMLPHFVREDLADVLADLDRAGLGLDLDWFAPFLEFRFPRYGRINAHGVELELGLAIEPWHVLGEETTAQGTARFVDSSVERLEVLVRGATDGRHVVACNRRRVPLFPTGTRGEFVAGVRYKAWQPPSGMHPTIGSHAPLVFDIVDTWNERAIGGCTYHVSHPGGRHYETLPVNASEAEARRIARFWPHGHTPGPMSPPPEEPSVDYPYTLDLRHRP